MPHSVILALRMLVGACGSEGGKHVVSCGTVEKTVSAVITNTSIYHSPMIQLDISGMTVVI